MDTEGYDPQVLLGAEKLFRSKRIKQAVIESMPKMWSRLSAGDDPHESVYKRILSYGYSIQCMKPVNKDWPLFTSSNADLWFEKMKENVCVDWHIKEV